jgi:hypothetical protein
MTITSHQHALPVGTALLEYRITGLLGAGAFGITYLARDTHLDKDVAIKEYLPSAFAARDGGGAVVPITQQQAADYQWGLDRFAQEARTLARFSHPNIVRVIRFFEGNATGYMVMDYERGESLKDFAAAHPEPGEGLILSLMQPLLDGLEQVHAAGFLHRDIKPDNIFVREDGGPVLLDFGSARQTAGDTGQPLTTVLTPGYAPFEQYTTSKPQGPWSDIYSLGGVLLFLITGKNPQDAISRMKGDTLPEALTTLLPRYSPALVEGLGWALALDESERPVDVATWRAALLGDGHADRIATPAWAGSQTSRVEPFVRTGLLAPVAAPVEPLTTTPQPITARLDVAAQAQPMPAQVQPTWNALLGRVLLLVACGLLALLLASLPVFREAQASGSRIGAGALVELAGIAAMLGYFWLFGRGLALRLRGEGGARAALCAVMTPVVTLIVVGIGYVSLQQPIASLLDGALGTLYARLFLLCLCACAIWLSMALAAHAEPLRELLQGAGTGARALRRDGSS